MNVLPSRWNPRHLRALPEYQPPTCDAPHSSGPSFTPYRSTPPGTPSPTPLPAAGGPRSWARGAVADLLPARHRRPTRPLPIQANTPRPARTSQPRTPRRRPNPRRHHPSPSYPHNGDANSTQKSKENNKTRAITDSRQPTRRDHYYKVGNSTRTRLLRPLEVAEDNGWVHHRRQYGWPHGHPPRIESVRTEAGRSASLGGCDDIEGIRLRVQVGERFTRSRADINVRQRCRLGAGVNRGRPSMAA